MLKRAFKVSIGGFSHHKKIQKKTKLPKLAINIAKIFSDRRSGGPAVSVNGVSLAPFVHLGCVDFG